MKLEIWDSFIALFMRELSEKPSDLIDSNKKWFKKWDNRGFFDDSKGYIRPYMGDSESVILKYFLIGIIDEIHIKLVGKSISWRNKTHVILLWNKERLKIKKNNANSLYNYEKYIQWEWAVNYYIHFNIAELTRFIGILQESWSFNYYAKEATSKVIKANRQIEIMVRYLLEEAKTFDHTNLLIFLSEFIEKKYIDKTNNDWVAYIEVEYSMEEYCDYLCCLFFLEARWYLWFWINDIVDSQARFRIPIKVHTFESLKEAFNTEIDINRIAINLMGIDESPEDNLSKKELKRLLHRHQQVENINNISNKLLEFNEKNWDVLIKGKVIWNTPKNTIQYYLFQILYLNINNLVTYEKIIEHIRANTSTIDSKTTNPATHSAYCSREKYKLWKNIGDYIESWKKSGGYALRKEKVK